MKTGLKIYGGLCIALFAIELVVTLAVGIGLVSASGETVTVDSLGMAVATAVHSSFLIVIGILLLAVAISVFCIFAVFLPLYILDVKGVDTRIYNIVLMSLFVVAVIVLAAVGAKLGSAALAILAVPAVPMLIYNAVSLKKGLKFAKKKAMLKLNEGQIVEEPALDNTDDGTK